MIGYNIDIHEAFVFRICGSDYPLFSVKIHIVRGLLKDWNLWMLVVEGGFYPRYINLWSLLDALIFNYSVMLVVFIIHIQPVKKHRDAVLIKPNDRGGKCNLSLFLILICFASTNEFLYSSSPLFFQSYLVSVCQILL